MGGAAPKVKTPPMPQVPPKAKGKSISLDSEAKKSRLDEETLNEHRRKKLCFTCKEPWEPSHRCSRKGKIHYIEVKSNTDKEE